jgi:hypothetical protein
MEQIAETSHQPRRAAAQAAVRTRRDLVLLLGALVGGLFIVVQLRQAGARESGSGLLWLLLIVAMFVAARALRTLELWLPGEPVLPRLAAFVERRSRIAGAVCLGIALLATTWVVVRLWPDYRKWDGTVLPWLVALALVLAGAWLLGAVGRASPRAATALALWPDTRRNRWLEAIAFVLILALAIFLRVYRIDSIPSGIYVDETNGGLDALHLVEGRADSPFGTGWYGTPTGYFYYMAGIFKLFGATWAGLKIASLIPAILTIPAVYILGRLMFGPFAGLAAMLLLSVSRWHLSMSRWGWNETAPPLFQVLATFFLIRGLRDRRALDYALSGLLAGLATYTYLSSRLAAATIGLYIIYWLWSDPAGWWAALRRCWLGLAILAVAAVMAVAPIAVTYLRDPFSFNNRVSEISVFRDLRDQNSVTPLLDNIGDALKFFHQTGDHQGKHNLPDEPMTDPITGLLFAVGLAYAILGWRDQRRMLLLLWLVIGMAGSFLSSRHESPQSYRALTALPAVVLLAANVLDRVTRALLRVLRERPWAAAGARLPTLAAGGLAIAVLAGATLWESGVYFGRQAQSTDVIRGFNPTENSVARETIAALGSATTVYLSPNFSSFSPLRFLVYGVVKAQTGKNTLDDRPYQVIVPEVNLPLPDTGQDALMLLDSTYWPLRDYVASFYPGAQMDLITLSDGAPIYMRVQVPHAQVAALQGLTERVAYADGQQEERPVTQIATPDNAAQVSEAEWTGAIRLEHGGEYELHGEGGLQIFLDGRPWEGKHYLGRGLYGLRVVRPQGASGDARLILQAPDKEAAPVPPDMLFRVAWPQQGLLGTYYRNMNWEGEPEFRQVTPFMLLAWPDEQPLVPNGEFSARFTGALRITEPGSYQFDVEADDGARLTLDGQVLGEGLDPGQPHNFSATVDLSAGDHPIQIDYFQQGGGSALKLFWSRDGGPETPVPPAALIPVQP